MTDIEPEEDLPPVAHVTMVYNGPVAPHWEMRPRYGDQRLVDDFWTRVNARLLLLPKHDPQFRRNRERVNRDAERERITCDWDLGDDDPETLKTVPAPVPGAPGSETAPEADDSETAPAADGAESAPAADGAETAPADTAQSDEQDVDGEQAAVDPVTEIALDGDPSEVATEPEASADPSEEQREADGSEG